MINDRIILSFFKVFIAVTNDDDDDIVRFDDRLSDRMMTSE